MPAKPSAHGSRRPLAVIETHPIQYRAPVYRLLQQKYRIPVSVIYGSDFSVAGYYDKEFRSEFAWDTDLLSGYDHTFLSRVADGGGRTYETVSARGLANTLRNLDPGAILIPGYSPRFHQWALLNAWISRLPIFFRGETSDRPQTTGAVELGLRDLLLPRLYQRCSKLLYIGQRSREHFKNYGCSDQKLIFSPYCIDDASFQVDEDARAGLRSKARTMLELGTDDTVLLFSGKLSNRKGPDLLVEAVRALPPKQRENTVILFLGNGDLLPVLEAAAALDPQVKVRFPGFQNQKHLSSYYHASDLLVLPSRRLETWGLVVNEALHHGLPCVISESVGCGPDLIIPGVTGELFENDSVQSLTAALARVSSLVGRVDIREACRRQVGMYSTDKAAEGIAEAYVSAV
jgi:glycosyltransferase involved in cell wall biosynthesis